MALPLQETCIREVKNIILYHIKPQKAPGYDLITGAVLRELPRKGFRVLTQIYNAILRLEHFPSYWKIGQIIMIAKPGKDPTEVTSYRPISLLPLLSKILKKTTIATVESHPYNTSIDPGSSVRISVTTRNVRTGAPISA